MTKNPGVFLKIFIEVLQKGQIISKFYFAAKYSLGKLKQNVLIMLIYAKFFDIFNLKNMKKNIDYLILKKKSKKEN